MAINTLVCYVVKCDVCGEHLFLAGTLNETCFESYAEATAEAGKQGWYVVGMKARHGDCVVKDAEEAQTGAAN